jgi:hypothetical protein
MTAPSVVPTLRHHTPENRPFDEFLAASCESRAKQVTRDPAGVRGVTETRLSHQPAVKPSDLHFGMGQSTIPSFGSAR